MSMSTKHKRLDNIEVQLTPKQWAIWLVDQIRKHASESDFHRAVARGTAREAPFVYPTYKLAEQAAAFCPGKDQKNVRACISLERNLRTEFRVFNLMILNINKNVNRNLETNSLRALQKLSALQTL